MDIMTNGSRLWRRPGLFATIVILLLTLTFIASARRASGGSFGRFFSLSMRQNRPTENDDNEYLLL